MAATMPGALAALLTYHVLSGTYPASAFTNISAFVPTLLTNTSYANVTGGQRVGGISNGTDVLISSGLLQQSKVTTAVSLLPCHLGAPTPNLLRLYIPLL
jgi:hypothetical protein